MIFYSLIFLILAILPLLFKRNLFILSISALCLVIIASFRGINIGADTHSYYEYFRVIGSSISGGHMEFLWNQLNMFVYTLGMNFNVFLFIVHGIMIYSVVYVAYKELENPQFALFIYYAMYAYCNSFNGMRQYLAVSLVLLSFYFLQNKHWVKYVIMIVVASLFHHSAIFAFLPLALYKVDLNVKRIIIPLIVALIIGMYVSADIHLDFLFGKYISYTEKEGFLRNNWLQSLTLCLLMNLYFLVLSLTIPKKLFTNMYYKSFFVGMILMNLTIKMTLGARIILYFTFVQIILIPLYFTLLNTSKRQKLLIQVCFILYFTAIFYKILSLGNSGEYSLYPYYMMIYSL